MLQLLFFIITFIWFVEFIYRKRNQSDQAHASSRPVEKRSLPIILISLLLTMVVSSYAVYSEVMLVSEWLSWIGLSIYASGVWLRWWGILSLGKYFSREIIVSEGMQLVSHGPYRILRHPLYTGLFFCSIGIPLAIGTYVGIVFGCVLVLPALLYRIYLEEKNMLSILGPLYDNWSQSRWRLIPYIY
jgi:protein-S-isoprenylcysteine O-methyltransferase Ste14